MPEIISRKAAIEAGLRLYFTGKPCKYGHVVDRIAQSGICVECKQIYNDRYRVEHPKPKNPKIPLPPEEARRRRYESSARWKNVNRDKWRAKNAQWARDNPDRIRLYVRINQKRLRKRTPRWADRKAIREFYERCPEGFHVDHIVPLNGKTVSGLHVLENLQYLPASVNRTKGNHWPGWESSDSAHALFP